MALYFTLVGQHHGKRLTTSSTDRRVKSNIVDAPSAVELIKDLQPRQYDLAISKNVRGFVADELQQVVPEAVVGTANAERKQSAALADYDRHRPTKPKSPITR